MEGQEGIAQRVADSITADTLTPAQVAAQIGLTDEELSESLRGLRAFSTVELVQLAELLKVDAHWLIAGRPGPYPSPPATTSISDRRRGWGAPDREGRSVVDRMVSMTVTAMVRPGRPPQSVSTCTVMCPPSSSPLGRGVLSGVGDHEHRGILYVELHLQAG